FSPRSFNPNNLLSVRRDPAQTLCRRKFLGEIFQAESARTMNQNDNEYRGTVPSTASKLTN
ncbi:hypothetical protein, partial [Klebsiella pneumoniae]|uniref:hypothetical protein n=1 Tax=Klebsiella pneumoniae TaxID=573 RepID=UPI003D36FB91